MKVTRTGGARNVARNPDFGHPGEPFADLFSALWRERELLEHLLFTLIGQQALLTAGLTRWLLAADARVAAAISELQEHEVLRAMATDALLQHVDLPPSASLADVVAAAATPWSSILYELQIALSGLTDEIDTAVARNDELLLASPWLTAEPGPATAGSAPPDTAVPDKAVSDTAEAGDGIPGSA